MKIHRLIRWLVAAICLSFAHSPVLAAEFPTLRLAYKADIASLDPHAIAEATQLDLLSNVYQGLVRFDHSGKVLPALAVRWEQRGDNIWRFHLRPDVRFAQGETFTSRDVVFNFARARAEKSGVQVFVSAIARVEAIDPLTVDFHLHRATPDLLRSLPAWYQLSASWCAAHDCQLDHNEAFVRSHTNGTGPYAVVKRVPGAVTLFKRRPQHNSVNFSPAHFSAVELRIIKDDAQRTAALWQGTADIINPLPLPAYASTKQNPQLQAISRADMRVLFLGMDQYRPELLYASVKGRNPLQDPRVRKALYLAIDVRRLQSKVMQDVARPTALLIPQGVFGYDSAQDQRPAFDPAQARDLLAQAGYPQGFQLRLNCPNDRYLNDEALCRAIASQLAEVGVRLDLKIEPKAQFFQQVLSGDTSFYLLGAGTNTDDALSILGPVLGSAGKSDLGGLNIGRFSNPRIDELLALAGATAQPAARSRYYREIQQLASQQFSHIPLLQPAALFGVRAGLQICFTPENGIPWDQIRVITEQKDHMSSTTQISNTVSGQHDFDFLTGDWIVHNQRLKQRFAGSNDWESFSARQTNRPLPAGIGNYDDFVAADWRPDFVGMSLRVFNPVTQLWSIYWLDNQSGGLNAQGQLYPPVVGKFEAGIGTFVGDDVIEGRQVKVRYVWSNISANTAHWEQAMSLDGGKNWEVNWKMAMTRAQATPSSPE